jgi:hypothetical protein
MRARWCLLVRGRCEPRDKVPREEEDREKDGRMNIDRTLDVGRCVGV